MRFFNFLQKLSFIPSFVHKTIYDCSHLTNTLKLLSIDLALTLTKDIVFQQLLSQNGERWIRSGNVMAMHLPI